MDFSDKMTGFFKAKCLYINPNKEELETITGDIFEEEPVYIKTKEDETKCAILDFYLSDNKQNIFKYTIWLEDEDKVSRNGSILYVNQHGISQYSNSEDNLWDNFKTLETIIDWITPDGEINKYYSKGAKPNSKDFLGNLVFRPSKVGEAELLHLLRMDNQFTGKKIEENVFYVNMEELFEGNFSSIRSNISDEFNFIAFTYLNDKYEQKIFKEFLPFRLWTDIINNMKMSKYSEKVFNEWKKAFDFLEGKHFHLDTLQKFREQFLTVLKEVAEDDDDY